MSATEDALWEIEESFWTQGADFASGRMADGAVMIFPYPAGILQGQEIAQGLKSAPRWRSVTLSDRRCRRRGNVAVLAYEAAAERAGEDIYKALCASTYIEDDDGWRLLSHQQTPAG